MYKKFLSAILFGAFMVTATGTFVSCKDYDDDIDNLQAQITSNKDAIAQIQAQIKSGQWVSNVSSTANGITVTLGNGQSYNITNGKDGVNGTNGKDGVNGTNGKDGVNGTNGKDGVNGTNGKDGTNGIDGVNGADGLTPQILVLDGVVYVSYDNGATKTMLIDLDDLKGKDGVDGTNGKDGVDGTNGKDGVDGTNGKDGVDGTNGKDGVDGKDPVFSVGEDGHLYVQYADDVTTKRDLGISISGIYYVENGITLEIHMPMRSIEGADEGYGVIKLPRAAAIVNLEALYNYGSSYIDTDDNDAAYIYLNYGISTQDITFNGKTYKKGQFLSSASSKVLVKINPVMADPSLYSLYLTDSKGNSPYSIKDVDNFMTVDPISRSVLEPTPNKGLYQMTIGFADGITKNDIPVKQDIAYCLATKDFYGNEVISKYDIVVTAFEFPSMIYNNDVQVEIGQMQDLDELLNGSAVDHMYSIALDQTAKKEALGVNLSGCFISGQKAGTIPVTVNYLTNSGTVGTATMTVTFVPKATVGEISDFNWTLTDQPGKNVVKVNVDNLKSYLFDGMNMTPNYIYSNNKQASDYKNVAASEGITDIRFEKYIDEKGYEHFNAVLTFDPTVVVPTTHIGTVNFPQNGDLPAKTINFNVNVSNATSSFVFQTLDAFFNSDKSEATAYGKPDGTIINYDLYNLFKYISDDDKDFIKFSEVVPQSYKVGNVTYTASPWLQSSLDNTEAPIKVAKAGVDETNHTFGGAYYPRMIKASYTPFGNKNAATVNINFNLTIKSEIAEGSLTYIKTEGGKVLAGDIKEVDGANEATLNINEILSKDVYGAKYSFATATMDPRVEGYKVVLGDQNANDYLLISANNFDGGAITISKKAPNTAITTPPVCNVTVKITDKWGKVTSVNVPVKVVK